MIISGVKRNSDLMNESENILIKMAFLYQMQDDYLDIWGDPEITGKIGTDISQGKCSWFVMSALKFASEKQKNLIKENCGRQNSESVEIVKSVFESLNIENLFQNERMKIISEIKMDIGNFKRKEYSIHVKIFEKYLSKMKFHLKF